MAAIAILGATSQIARDYNVRALRAGHELKLFSRRPDDVARELKAAGLGAGYDSLGYERFGEDRYDAIINFVGSGDPARTEKMGVDIFEVTARYDRLACEALKRAPDTRYIFLSSGAAYGSTFLEPVDDQTQARIPINALSPRDYYGLAKLYAEARHRAMPERAIIDLRMFGYFSRSADLAARFFLTDILRAIHEGQTLPTGEATMWRDFLCPDDFFALVEAVLSAAAANTALDAFSKAPVEKFELLEAMRTAFGLNYQITPAPQGMTATGAKPHYYSRSRRAESFGYQPASTSLEGVLAESRARFASLKTGRN